MGVCVNGGFSITTERENYRAYLIAEKTITRCELERQARITTKDFSVSEGKN